MLKNDGKVGCSSTICVTAKAAWPSDHSKRVLVLGRFAVLVLWDELTRLHPSNTFDEYAAAEGTMKNRTLGRDIPDRSDAVPEYVVAKH